MQMGTKIEKAHQKADTEFPNNSYEIESRITDYIGSGDTNGLYKFIMHMPTYHAGTVAADVIRNRKNYFIATCTVATRTAIAVGLNTETAYALSDSYISEVEKQDTIEQIDKLFIEMLMDITAQVAEHKNSLQIDTLSDLPGAVRDAVFYIQTHVHESINVQSVADDLGYNRSYLSKAFSESLGFGMGDFIYRCKLEEAKSLLAYTDRSLGDIAASLCFSSQSHFQKRFKETFHMTPARYREKMRG